MPHYRRLYLPGGTYFFTVAILDRQLRLLTENIAILRQAFRLVKAQHPFDIEAIVILPEHLHCMWTLPQGDADFSTRWRLIKSSFSRELAGKEQLSARQHRKGEKGLWQRRFWEHAIRDQHDFSVHFDYIHYNPVKHGWAVRAADWPYSSFHQFVRSGVYPQDWAASTDVAAKKLE